MTTEEFSNEFDVLVSEVSTFNFNEYEKSVFLTEAQENIVKGLYTGKLTGESLERTEELRRYLSNLIKDNSPKKASGTILTRNSQLFTIPTDVWFITYEFITSQDERLGCAKGSTLQVIPTTQDELYKVLNNPFRRPNRRKVLRLDVGENIVELISDFTISGYHIRYLSQPDPIILVDLPKGLYINKENKRTDCKLNPAIHRVILEMAVSLALKSRTSAGK